MAEGRRDRSGRRRRRSAAHQERNDRYRASSDGEVAPCEAAGIGRPPCHFHEGLDVDQLARYRRRQVKDKPRDHLGCLKKDAAVNDDEEEEEEDEFERQKRLVTEYRLAFRASSDDIFHDSKDLLSPIRRKRHVDDNSSDKNKIDENLRASDHVPLNNKNSNTLNNKSEIEKDSGKIMEMGTDALKRPAPIRRGTTLRCEGDFNADTEYTNYVPFLGLHRSELRRRGTSLRMEGDFAGNTEKNDKFIEWPVESCRRPEPIRLPSHLRLEGDLQTSTESHDKYVPFIGARRPEILKQSAQLKLEGDSNWTAEYADVFQKYDFVDRRAPKIPESSLKPGGGFYDKTETKDLFTNPRDKETELMAELAKDAEEEEEKKKKEEEEEKNRLKKEEEMRLLVSKLEDLKSPVLEIPEYKDAYK